MRRLDVWSNGRKGGIIVSSRITGCALCTRVSVTGSTKVGIWKRCRILRPSQRKSRSDVGGSNATLIGLRRIERFNSPKTALVSSCCIPSLPIFSFSDCNACRSFSLCSFRHCNLVCFSLCTILRYDKKPAIQWLLLPPGLSSPSDTGVAPCARDFIRTHNEHLEQEAATTMR